MLRFIILFLATLAAQPPARAAVDPNEWKNRQAVAIDRAGIIKLTLPPATLDAARPNLEDLRLLDPAGRETPFLIERAPRRNPLPSRPPRTFRVTLTGNTEILLESGMNTALDEVILLSPASNFLKAARVEVSADGTAWRLVQNGVPVFRQFGVEQLHLDLDRQTAAHIRITLDDARTQPVPITGAVLLPAPAELPPPTSPLPIRSLRREEFAGETVFTLDLGVQHVPLATLEFPTTEPLFARSVTIGVRELRDDVAVERTLAAGSIYRVAAEGLPARSRLELPLDFAAPSRELLIHVANGDSPPLAFDELRVRQRPVWLIFRAADPGAYTVLTGHGQIAAARYDLAPLGSALRTTTPSDLVIGPPDPNPGYRQTDPLGAAALQGAALDPAAWPYRKAVQLAAPGVQELELDVDVLAHAQPGFADLRLVREGAQVPYLLERPGLTRSAPLGFVARPVPANPRLSRWEIKLPRSGLPLARLTLSSPTVLFQRQVRLFEKISDERSGSYERTLADAAWSHSPGNAASLVFSPTATPSGDTLLLETDNGDNPPIAISSVIAAYPVARLLFRTDAAGAPAAAGKVESGSPGSIALYYGNRQVGAPRYDLALMGAQILAAEKTVALLGAEEAAQAGGWASQALAGMRGGALFWGVLGLVVVVLLLVVARLLPKPPAAGTQ